MKRIIALVLPVLILLALIGWRLVAKRTEAAAMEGQRAARGRSRPLVCAVPVQTRDIVSVFQATGTLEAPLNVKISSKTSGRIEYLTVHEGDRVRRGQVLVRLDGSEIEAEVRRQQAAVAEADYRIAQAQINQGPTTASIDSQIKQQKASVASAEADLKQVETNLASLVAAAEDDVAETQARIASADASIANAQANINKVQATLNNAQSRLNRILDLYQQGFIAAQDVDDAKAEVAVQQASLEAAQGLLESARGAREAVVSQKRAAEHQVKIVRTKGEADIEAARQKLNQARASLDLARANTAQSPAYKQGIAALKASAAAARANLAAAKARRQETVLTCPLDGYVTERIADPGSMATPGQPLLAVQFLSRVWVSMAVPDAVCARLREGQGVEVRFDTIPDRQFTATIVQINPAADPQARQFTVRAALDNANGDLRPGMFAHVGITTDRLLGTLAVPREAVQTDEAGEHVFVVNGDGKVSRRGITSGLADATYTSVTSGLQPGEQVVTMCAVPLKDGQEVRTEESGGEKGGAPGADGGAKGRMSRPREG